MECNFMPKNGMCTQVHRKERETRSKDTWKETKSHFLNYWNSQQSVLDKWNVAKIHNNLSFSCKRCFLSVHLKVKVAEDLMQSGIEDHTIRSTNVKEHFPEELTPGRLLAEMSGLTNFSVQVQSWSAKLNPIQSWSAKFLKIISPIQSWSANVKSCISPHGAK